MSIGCLESFLIFCLDSPQLWAAGQQSGWVRNIQKSLDMSDMVTPSRARHGGTHYLNWNYTVI